MRSLSQPTTRKTNLDLLRLFALFLVVLIHLSTAAVKVLPPHHINWYIATFLDALARPAVHLFILLGGFFLGHRELTQAQALQRALKLIPPLIIFAVMYAVTMLPPFSYSSLSQFVLSFINGKLNYHTPQWYGHLWFLYPYATLLLLSPFINRALKDLPQKEFKQIISLFTTLFLVAPSLSLLLGTRVFYTVGQPLSYFITSYITGAYLRKYPPTLSSLSLWAIYAGATLWTWAMTIVQTH